MGLRHIARERKEQGHRVLCCCDNVRFRRVGNDYAVLGGGFDIDIVDSHPGAADDLQVRGGVEQLGIDIGC
ncbi:unannotated protein [freshwater metagenome]|uniref:Unannotated protein n=1 Tax=freshwater metagenome TaxID=449393 RepID=A0A6J5ZPW2_9ZZZZ